MTVSTIRSSVPEDRVSLVTSKPAAPSLPTTWVRPEWEAACPNPERLISVVSVASTRTHVRA